MTTMGTSGRRPLVPIVLTIQYRKSTPRRMDIPLRKPSWHPYPSLRFLYSTKWRPEDNSMRYSGFFELISCNLFIMFLSCNTPESWKSMKRCKKLIPLSCIFYDKIGIFSIVLTKYTRTRSVVYKIIRDEVA